MKNLSSLTVFMNVYVIGKACGFLEKYFSLNRCQDFAASVAGDGHSSWEASFVYGSGWNSAIFCKFNLLATLIIEVWTE